MRPSLEEFQNPKLNWPAKQNGSPHEEAITFPEYEQRAKEKTSPAAGKEIRGAKQKCGARTDPWTQKQSRNKIRDQMKYPAPRKTQLKASRGSPQDHRTRSSEGSEQLDKKPHEEQARSEQRVSNNRSLDIRDMDKVAQTREMKQRQGSMVERSTHKQIATKINEA
ncbi:hypothetical protein NDU88_000177 [Pleurodeles waltl]|uniref:Uncharacterized protein n=1 Tax=Pleurodeles waltl TaxID=8319 RepID=A0AAV7R7H8_PLEWA|nr:hypothetical protein NDU88_000177 [Pleurodeles waltl]